MKCLITLIIMLMFQPVVFCGEVITPLTYDKLPEIIEYDEIVMKTTAYSAGDDCDTGNVMANGNTVHEGAVACNIVPLGTVILIDNVEYTVEDRVGDDGTVDIYMNDRTSAINYGVKYKTIKFRR